MGVLRVSLDANCLIYMFNPQADAYNSMQKIKKASEDNLIQLVVSRHILSELEIRLDNALEYAQSLEMLPHFPIGNWDEQISGWNQAQGSWEQSKRNQEIQQEIQSLANSGNDIRDRGGYLDSLLDKVDVFVTYDKQLRKPGPAQRLEEKFGLKVLTPQDFVSQFLSSS